MAMLNNQMVYYNTGMFSYEYNQYPWYYKQYPNPNYNVWNITSIHIYIYYKTSIGYQIDFHGYWQILWYIYNELERKSGCLTNCNRKEVIQGLNHRISM